MIDFGIIIGCYRRDYSFATGVVAAARHYMPDTPICLLIDGEFPVDEMKRAYDIQSLHRAQIKDDFLREHSFGWGLPKMTLFWESPFERFLFLDADAIPLGDLRPKLFTGSQADQWDMFIDKPRYVHKDNDVSAWFFNTENIERAFPNFNWRNYSSRYYCTGVWAARRGIFPLDEYKAIMELRARQPDLFFPGEMGFLNFMIFRAESEGRLKIASDEIQILAADFSVDELCRLWQIDQPPPKLAAPDIAALHYVNIKPTVAMGKIARPMTYFRKQAAIACGKSSLGAIAHLRHEDVIFDLRRWRIRATAIARRLVKGRTKADK